MFRVQNQGFNAAEGFNGDFGFAAHHIVVVQVFADTADAVAAHFSLGAVGVEHAHFCVCNIRGADQDDAVAADAEVMVGQAHRKLLRIVHRMSEAVEIYIIIAAAVHFCKGKLHEKYRSFAEV